MLRISKGHKVVVLLLCVLVTSCSIEVHTLAQYRPTAKAEEEPTAYTVYVEPLTMRGTFNTETRFPNLAGYLTEAIKYYTFETGLFGEVLNEDKADLVLKLDLRKFNCEQENEGWGLVLNITGGLFASSALMSLAIPQSQEQDTTEETTRTLAWPWYLGMSAACFVPGILIPYTKAELELDVELVEPGTIPRSEGKAVRVIDKRKV